MLNVNLSLCLLLRKDNQELFAKTLNENVNSTSVNGWMNELLKLHWCNEILGQFSFSRQLLALGFFKAHLTDDVRKSLKLSETGTVIVRGGCTKFIQAPDLVWKKPFKGRIQELYDEWPASRKHEFNAAVNIKPVPRRYNCKFYEIMFFHISYWLFWWRTNFLFKEREKVWVEKSNAREPTQKFLTTALCKMIHL